MVSGAVLNKNNGDWIMNIIFAVACGGALGAVLRYISEVLFSHHIDILWITVAVNVVGSLVLGVFVMGASQLWTIPEELRTFVTVGLLGAFTTFSTFSLHIVNLLALGNYNLAIIYLLSSVILSVGALYLGIIFVKAFLA